MRAIAAARAAAEGDRVHIQGLVKAAELNGRRGVITGKQPGSDDRWQVSLDSGEDRAIRSSNLTVAEWSEAELAHRRKALDARDEVMEPHFRQMVDAFDAAGGAASAEVITGGYQSLIGQGLLLLGRGKADEALAKYREAIELEPQSPDAYLNGAHALQELGDHSGASDYFLSAMERCEAGGDMWAQCLAEAFQKLMSDPELPRPSWWTDEQLLELSKKAAAVAKASRGPWVWRMVGATLAGQVCCAGGSWPGFSGATRTVAQMREASACYSRAAEKAKGTREEPDLRADARQLMEVATSAEEGYVFEVGPSEEEPAVL